VIRDLRTVIWKEWRSVRNGRARRQIVLMITVLSVFAIISPISLGQDWATDPVMMLIQAVILPMVVVGVVVPDAIAGERERHTLSTLLASRLPDRAILYGKLGFAVAFGWILAPFVLAIALVAANLAAIDAAPFFYDPLMLVGALILALLVALMTGGIGIFASLRAPGVQEAQQMTLLGLMIPVMLGTVGMVLIGSNPELGRRVLDWLGSAEAGYAFAGVVVLIAVVDAVLLLAADRRFRRGRLALL
jgi:ABC-2 type transport system permease protein